MAINLDVKFTVEVTKTVAKKRVRVGDIEVYMPSLQQLATYLASADLTPKAVDEQGVPEYKSDVLDWLQRTIKSAAYINARNKYEIGTTTLKAGATVATTLEDLCTVGTPGGNGEALKQLTELRNAFNAYIDELGKAPKTAGLIKQAFKDVKGFSLQPSEIQDKLIPYFNDFHGLVAGELTPVQAAHINKLLDASAASDEDDFDDL